jgi:hypothetical protein
LPVYVYEDPRTGEQIEQVFSIHDEKPVAIRHPLIINKWYYRIITPVSFRMDKGRLFSPAFGKEFKNEKDERDYAKHHGFSPMDGASLESVEKDEKDAEREREKKLYAGFEESVQWSLKDA